MSVRVLFDREQGIACWFDSTNGTALGPVFADPAGLRDEANGIILVDAENVAEAFAEHLRTDLGVGDPRHLNPTTLLNAYVRWRAGAAGHAAVE